MSDMKVYFNEYCKTCNNEKTYEEDEPCDECLAYPCNEDSHKPESCIPGGKVKIILLLAVTRFFHQTLKNHRHSGIFSHPTSDLLLHGDIIR